MLNLDMRKKRLTAVQIHAKKAGSKGGKAIFAKIGSEGMRALVKRRWSKA